MKKTKVWTYAEIKHELVKLRREQDLYSGHAKRSKDELKRSYWYGRAGACGGKIQRLMDIARGIT